MKFTQFLQRYKRSPGDFIPISRHKILKPPFISKVQTDGSFTNDMSRTAVLLTTFKKEEFKLSNTYYDNQNSTEAEWRSVQDGIVYSLKKDCGAIELENDNLGVMTHLIKQNPPAQGYLANYYYDILQLARQMEWLSIRWIPRYLNRADDIFRVNKKKLPPNNVKYLN